MNIFSKNLSDPNQISKIVKRVNYITIFSAVLCYGFMIYLLVFNFELVKYFFTDYEKLQTFISPEFRNPILAIAFFFSIFIFVNPFGQLIPVTTLVSFFYGFKIGFIFTLVSVFISSILTLYLSRHMGLKIVKRFLGEDTWKRVEVLMHDEGIMPFLIAHIIPLFPDSMVVWVSGLSKVSIPKLVIGGWIARIPGIILSSAIGSGVVLQNKFASLIGIIVLTTLGLVLTKYRKKIIRFIDKRKKKKEF